MSHETLDGAKDLDKASCPSSDRTAVAQTAIPTSGGSSMESPNSITSLEKSVGHSEGAQTSVLSKTSTAKYGVIPWDEFELQVQKLCHLLWLTPSINKSTAKRRRRRFNKAQHKRES